MHGILFAGQGAQYYHMGRAYYKDRPIFKYYMDLADEMMKDLLRKSLVERLYHPSKTVKDEILEIDLSHTSLFAVQYAAAQAIFDDREIGAVSGFSLGELVAAAVAGILSFEESFLFILKQVIWLESSCEQGILLTVLASKSEIAHALDSHQEDYEYAISFGDDYHTLSMLKSGVDIIEQKLRRKGIGYQKVSAPYAFHSRWINSIYPDFISYTRSLAFQQPNIDFVSCVKSKSLIDINGAHMWDVIRGWVDISKLIHLTHAKCSHIVDASPGGTFRAQTRTLYGMRSDQFTNTEALFSRYTT